MNIIKADLFRFIKDKTTYVLLAIMFVLSPLIVMMYRLTGFNGFTSGTVILNGLSTDIFCALMGLQISLFIGKDYTNNTIRNKLCYGENRFKVAGIYFLESVLITLLFICVNFLSSFAFGSIFGELSFASDFVPKYFCQIAILISFSVMMTSIVVSTKSIKAGFMATLIISVILSAISYALPSLATKIPSFEYVCRSLYMVVSTMLLSSQNGTYYVGSFAFENIYTNAAILSSLLVVLSIGITMFVVKKHNYK